MAHPMTTVHGGAMHGMATLSHSEFQAAQHALSKISSSAGTLGSKLGGLSQSATSIGGSVRAQSLHASGLLPGTGSDTFFGGTRSSLMANIGNDTIVGGSAKSLAAGLDSLTGHSMKNFALSADTINIAGTTALSVRTFDPAENVKGHTLNVGDKTTVTINGLSNHDISKLTH